MKAIVYRDYGPADVLRFEETAKPAPKAGEVLIKVRAASVNPLDWHMMRATPSFIRLIAGLRRPKDTRMGVDVAGEVEAVGSGATQFKPGDAVFGTCKGAFAEYACAPESQLAAKPPNLTFEQAASSPVAAFTALQALRDKGKVQPGQQVLINGAAGGVGVFAVQIARGLGAQVTGVCSTRNLEMVRSIGADSVIDYTCQDFTTDPQRYDAFFDLVGNRSLTECLRVLKTRGVYIPCGGGGPDTPGSRLLAGMIAQAARAPFLSQKISGILAKPNQPDLNLIRDLMESGKVVPVIDRNYPLNQVPDAIRYIETGHARGKVLITVE